MVLYSSIFILEKLIYPIGPTLDPEEDKKGSNWDKYAHCKYHRGNKHRSNDCYRLKHLIHNMIENGRLPIFSNKALNKIDVADMGTRDYLKPRQAQKIVTSSKMTYTQIFHQLWAKGVIFPIGPIEDP